MFNINHLDTKNFDINDSLESSVDIPMLEAWGMNLMRLGVMWEAVEIAPGVYN